MWGNWSDIWSPCNESCGDSGIQKKNRSKLQDASNGGQNCTGEDIKYQECNRKNCPGITKNQYRFKKNLLLKDLNNRRDNYLF